EGWRVAKPGVRGKGLALRRLCAEWTWLTLRIALTARKQRGLVSTASHHFLMCAGYVTLAWSCAMQERAARRRMRDGGQESLDFYQAKIATSDFYFSRLLPRARSHAKGMLSPVETTMGIPGEHFAFE